MVRNLGSLHLFGYYIPVPLIILAVLEALIFYFSLFIGAAIRLQGFDGIQDVVTGPVWPRAVVFSFVMLLSILSMGLYQARLREGAVGVMLRVAVACAFGGIATTLVYYAVPGLYVGRGIQFFAVGVSFALVGVIRVLFLLVVDENIFKRKVLVYGSGKKALSLDKLRRRSDRRSFTLVGFVQADNEKCLVDPEKILKVDGSLSRFALQERIVEIVIAIDDRRRMVPVKALLDCRLMGIEITDLITFLERETGKVRLDLLYPSWIIFSNGFTRNQRRWLFKRAFDIFAATLMLSVSWPLFVLTAACIKIEDGLRASVLYRQRRVGLDGQEFQVMKFRSMNVDAEKAQSPKWAEEEDARVTKVGKVIRKLRIDELPQLLNVLKSEMAFVGPRPERPHFVKLLSEKIPYYEERHYVKPGITGWAQLSFPYGSSEDDAKEKLQYDLYYLKNHSFLFDLQILIQTTEVVLFGKGAR